MFKLITDELFHYKENQFDSGYDYGNEVCDRSVIVGAQRSPNSILLDEKQQAIFDETLSQFDNLQLPDMDFEAGHIVDTKFKILNKDSKDLQNEIKVVFGCDTSEQTGSITIENLKVEVKSNDFSLKHPSVGGAEGKMTL